VRKFFEALNTLVKPGKREIIEKDYHLHRILYEISEENHLANNLVFKGGTCLMKAYTGYYRFSEDIDFTWKDSGIWVNKSPSQVRRLCSQKITTLIEQFKIISDKLDLTFEGDKADNNQVHISSGGRMVQFFIRYDSEILDRQEWIKVEINFVDKIIYPFQKKTLKSYVEGVKSEELRFLYKEPWMEYNRRIQLDCYDPREIFIEKCRAAVTRKAYKLRDIIDIYHLEKEYDYTIINYKQQITEKTEFILEQYNRYQENMEIKKFPKPYLLNHEELNLMITKPPKDLSQNIERIHQELELLRNGLSI